jgi:hypothetical protein
MNNQLKAKATAVHPSGLCLHTEHQLRVKSHTERHGFYIHKYTTLCSLHTTEKMIWGSQPRRNKSHPYHLSLSICFVALLSLLFGRYMLVHIPANNLSIPGNLSKATHLLV